MKSFVFAVVIACVVFNQVLACPNGFTGHDGLCYHFSHDKQSWSDAADMCEKLNSRAKLAEIGSDSEHTWVGNEVNRLGHDYWIGGYDVQVEDEWRWLSTGNLIGTTYWRSGEPSNDWSNENCIEYKGTGWNDDRCNEAQRYICEMPD